VEFVRPGYCLQRMIVLQGLFVRAIHNLFHS
jgi:hypothetical protein